MTRGILLVTAALLGTGCRPPCDAVTNVYWSFDAPGLVAPNDCAAAGIDEISIWVDGVFVADVPCRGPQADGIQLVGYGPDSFQLTLDAYAGGAISGTRRYVYDRPTSSPSCTTSVDVVADAIPGRLDLDYLFSPVVTCASNSYAWFQLRGPAGEIHDIAPLATTLTCGTPDPVVFPGMAPGVYTLSRFEVGVITGPTTWTPNYNACAAQQFIHAGDSTVTTTLTPAVASCWP